MYLAFLMLVPLLIGLLALFTSRGKITIKEFLLMEGACLVILFAGWQISRWTSLEDREILSGRITEKKKVQVGCRHSYSCNCTDHCSSDSRGNQSCITVCQTCYDHSYDYDWNLYTNVPATISIGTVDRQGLIMPPRWGTAYVGEPVAVENTYTNCNCPLSGFIPAKQIVKSFS